MIPITAVKLVDCEGVQEEVCARVAAVTASVADDGGMQVAKVTAVIDQLVDMNVQALMLDEVEYRVLATKQVPAACITKVEAFRTVLTGCGVCDGYIRNALIVDDCDQDSLDFDAGSTAVRFTARHLKTETRKITDILTHIETYELTFEGFPLLNTDNIVDGCGKLFKVRDVMRRGGVLRPQQVIAEVTTRPRANI